MELCIDCKKRPIQNKKRQLCNTCCTRLYRHVIKAGGSLKDDLDSWTEQLQRRYPGIMDEIEKLFVNPYWTLQDVADRVGVTREYIRQLFNKLYNAGIKNGLLEWRQNVKLENQTACKRDPRYKVAEYADGLHRKGAIAEKSVWDRCEALGFEVKSGPDTIYDLEVNGFKVDVKGCWKAVRPNNGALSKYYRFQISAKQQELCDFLICMAMPQEIAYIIPRIDFPDFTGKPQHLYIRSTDKHFGPQKNGYPDEQKWEQYKEAWHLLSEDFNSVVWPKEVNG